MNYRLVIIILGVLMFVAAMIPYAYAPRCTDATAIRRGPTS